MNQIISIFIFVVCVPLVCSLFFYGIRKKWFLFSTHPYTNKRMHIMIFEYAQLAVAFIAFVYCALFFGPLPSFFFIMVFASLLYLFLKRNNGHRLGRPLYTWTYSEASLLMQKEKTTELLADNEKRKQRIRILSTKKVVFTDLFIFYAKKKKLSVFRQRNEQLDLINVSIEHQFLVFHYSIAHLVQVKRVYVYIPDTKLSEAKTIASLYNESLSPKKRRS